jgi:hypothetical protein
MAKFLRDDGTMRLIGAALILVVTLTLPIEVGHAQQTPTPPAAADPGQVVESFESARGAGDVDAAMAELADTAVITVQGQSTRSFSGTVQLRMYLQSIGTRFQTVMRSKPVVRGTSVSWTEQDQFGSQARDTSVVAVVSAGRIVTLTYRDNTQSPVVPGGRTGAARRLPAPLPSATWPLALAVFGIGLMALVWGRPSRKASRSELDGRLLAALRREHRLDLDRDNPAA